jgi:acetoin utilization protein AcuB
MFQVRDLGGINRLYVPGEIRMRRGVDPIVVAQGVSELSTATHSSASKSAVQRGYGDSEPAFEQHELKFAHEIMTSPVNSIDAQTSMSEVNSILTAKRYRHLPVVSSEQELVGLISDRDALRFNAAALIEKKDLNKVKVSEIMVTGILTATPDTLIRDLARIMFEERIGSLPIVDSHLGLVGIVTRSDILRALLKHGPLRLWA